MVIIDDIEVYPLTLKQAKQATKYFTKFNIDLIEVALLVEESREAILEVIKLATKLSDEEINELDIATIPKIIRASIGA